MGVARPRKELVRIKAKRDCWDWFVQVEIKSILNKNYREVKILISHHIYIYIYIYETMLYAGRRIFNKFSFSFSSYYFHSFVFFVALV
jgi:hypothetical protein